MQRFVSLIVLSLFMVTAPAVAEDRPAAAAPSKKVAAPRTQRPATGTATATTAATAKAEAKKRAVLARPAPRSLAEARRRLDAIRVDVDFKDMKMPEIVAFIGRIAGFNVIVGPELQRDGPDGLPTITLRLRRVSLRQVADLVARFSGTKLALREGILSFTTPEAARGRPTLRIYAIGELTATIHNFPGPGLNLRPSGAEFEQEEITEVENPYSDPEKIIEMLREFVASETWEDDGVSAWADTRKLVVRQYPEVQRKIARFLALLRASR